jgi:hypothetical protein
MVGVRRMTEPNVLANGGRAGGAKFLFENGNTEIINLWSDDDFGGVKSMHGVSAGTLNGVAYQVPVGRVFYLLNLCNTWNSGNVDICLQKNTTVDTATGGTTLWQAFSVSGNTNFEVGYLKFVAGEYVTINVTGGNDQYWNAWGVECDA